MEEARGKERGERTTDGGGVNGADSEVLGSAKRPPAQVNRTKGGTSVDDARSRLDRSRASPSDRWTAS